MMIRMLALTAGAITALTLTAPAAPAYAGGNFGGGFTGNKNQICTPVKPTVNKTFNFNKTVNFNKNVIVNKPLTINKNINIQKNIDLSKHIEIKKNFDLSKNIEINKKIIINKGNAKAEAEAEAFAFAFAMASAQASANANAASSSFAFAHGGSSFVTVLNRGGEIGQIAVAPVEEQAEAACVTQWASVVKSIHAECIDRIGEHHPATRMISETWVDSSLSKELYRCLEGSSLKVIIGDVVQSDQGLAGIYEGGQVLVCKSGEALRHFQDGLVKCAIAEKVPDCTERSNLRKYGVGDLFFSYQTQVCARIAQVSESTSSQSHGYAKEGYSKGGYSSGYTRSENELQLSGMSLDGGVGYAQ